MAIVVACQCGQQFRAKDEYAGREMKCPKCGSAIRVPGAAQVPAQLPPAQQPAQQPPVPQHPTAAGGSLDALMQMDAGAGMQPGAAPGYGGQQMGMPQHPTGYQQPMGMPGGFQGGFGGGQPQRPSGGGISGARLAIGIVAGIAIVVAAVVIIFKLSGDGEEVAQKDDEDSEEYRSIEGIGEKSNATGNVGPPGAQGGPGFNPGGNPPGGNPPGGPGGSGTGTTTNDPPEEEAEVELTTFDLTGAATKWLDEGESLWGVKIVDEDAPEIYGFGWLVEVLPYVGEQDLYDNVDFDNDFTSASNLGMLAHEVDAFLNPNQETTHFEGLHFTGCALTHFVGISGAEDTRHDVAAKFERSDPRAGVFGYHSVAKLNDIGDGLGQTLMVVGSEKTAGPWFAGGGFTIRGARKNSDDEYIGGYYGFWTEGLEKPGALGMFADGSVREISADIDGDVFRAMSTINGGEADFDAESLGKEHDGIPPGMKTRLIEEARRNQE